jgi:hypothetical protein
MSRLPGLTHTKSAPAAVRVIVNNPHIGIRAAHPVSMPRRETVLFFIGTSSPAFMSYATSEFAIDCAEVTAWEKAMANPSRRIERSTLFYCY